MSALGLIARAFPVEGTLKLAIAGGALFLAFAGGFYQGAARVEQRLQKAQLETTATVLQTERQYRERENAIVKEYLDRIKVLKENYEKQIISAGSLRDVFSPRAECVPDTDKSSAAALLAACEVKPWCPSPPLLHERRSVTPPYPVGRSGTHGRRYSHIQAKEPR